MTALNLGTVESGQSFLRFYGSNAERRGGNVLAAQLLDGIPDLQKVLLLDSCFSRQIDKDVGVTVAGAATGDAGTVTMRAFERR